MHDDYRLDGLAAATPMDEADTELLLLSADMHHLLASHHSEDGRRSYLLAYDQTAIWSHPGAPSFLAVSIQRDPAAGTYAIDHRRQPLLPLAQNWLIRHGCPPAEIGVNAGPTPYGPDTAEVEARLRGATDHQYTVLDHYTAEPVYPTQDGRTWALLYDHDPAAATAPFRVVTEHTTADLDQYSVTEDTFPTLGAARDWLSDRDGRLLATPRAHAARSRSTGAAVTEAGKAEPLPTAERPASRTERSQPPRSRS